jgi:hypothetical protein
MFTTSSVRCSQNHVEGLEGRRLLSGTCPGMTPTGPAATPALVVKPDFTPVLGTYAGDFGAGSTVDGFTATGEFKLVWTSYNPSTGFLTGKYYISDYKVDGESVASIDANFSRDAHLTSGGGFDLHLAGDGGNAKLKGDYKRDNTYISGTLVGTLVSGSKTFDYTFNFDLSKRS